MKLRTRLFHGFLGLLLNYLWIWIWCFGFGLLFLIVDDPYAWTQKQGFHIPFWGAAVTSVGSLLLGAVICPIIYSFQGHHHTHPAVFSSFVGALFGAVFGVGLGGSLFHISFSVIQLTFPDDVTWIVTSCVLLSGIVSGCVAGVALNWKYPNRVR
jgi:hypothetical protein